MRQPGTVACLAITLAAINKFAGEAWRFFAAANVRRNALIDIFLLMLTLQFIAPAVALAWIVLAISRTWRHTADWVDRLGRLVGVTWLALYALSLVRMYWNLLF